MTDRQIVAEAYNKILQQVEDLMAQEDSKTLESSLKTVAYLQVSAFLKEEIRRVWRS